ncbi:alpha/beta fold hydrolase [Nocardioides marmoraquaticus]
MTSTHTLAVDGATLTYDVHGERRDGEVPLLLIGSPMDASGFGTLLTHLGDRVTVTYDPRNTGRSTRDDRTAGVSAEQHAADLHALVQHLGAPVDVFASSGGADNALVLVARHPDDVRLLVAHEPPMAGLLPDRAELRQVCDGVVAAYDEGGTGPAMARFIALPMHRGPVTEDYLRAPVPDPATFGLPTDDDGSRDDAMVANMRDGGIDLVPDVEAIGAAPTRVVVGVGEESGGPDDGEEPARAAYSIAAALGQQAVVFPGGHAGFLGGEFGQTGKPAEFAARLREVLAT